MVLMGSKTLFRVMGSTPRGEEENFAQCLDSAAIPALSKPPA